MARKKRGVDEGSIGQRPDGRWMAQATTAKKPDGSPRRLTFYGKTRKQTAEMSSLIRLSWHSGSLSGLKTTRGTRSSPLRGIPRKSRFVAI